MAIGKDYARRAELEPVFARFEARTLFPSPAGCLEWPGATSAGYGVIQHHRIGSFYAHRIAYAASGRRPDPRKVIRHLCGNRLCCNIEHLVEGTHAENTADYRREMDRKRLIGAGVYAC